MLLHLGLLALLLLVTFPTRNLVLPPAGMEIEILDLDHAMPLPQPELAHQESSETAARPLAAALQSEPAAIVSPVPNEPPPIQQPVPRASAPAMPEPVVSPVRVNAPVAPALGPGPVRVLAPAVPAPPTPPLPAPPSAAMSRAAPSPAASTPAPRRLDAAALARTLGTVTGAASRPRLNSAAIGSAIGQAVPRGVAGLTIRQRTNLAEMIRSQITPCWNPPQVEETSGHVTILMRIKLGRDGAVAGAPVVSHVSGQTAANGAYANAVTGSVRRAILRCSPLKLPSELYEAWADVEINFDPRDVQ
ncbi:hypothetical protein GGQ88_003781 [Novosphingobium hassiacum]|uniref:Cell envelope biogenesis protein TolA n=1 Tax=Novosphingobium hassiacum TaxID=173676 RepID=A0A7W5ZYP6_9SPHN|nr:hypothetical protein [Novosphingobium hassiacum]MBB3862480.1 hypothetical protein [Novosphingobium hassiacum]